MGFKRKTQGRAALQAQGRAALQNLIDEYKAAWEMIHKNHRENLVTCEVTEVKPMEYTASAIFELDHMYGSTKKADD